MEEINQILKKKKINIKSEKENKENKIMLQKIEKLLTLIKFEIPRIEWAIRTEVSSVKRNELEIKKINNNLQDWKKEIEELENKINQILEWLARALI